MATKQADRTPIDVECLKGAAEICDFIKEDHKIINDLVKNEGLPAWKRSESGPWRALNIDLQRWMLHQRNKYMKDTPKYLSKMVVNT
jgi:hypothetical protein